MNKMNYFLYLVSSSLPYLLILVGYFLLIKEVKILHKFFNELLRKFTELHKRIIEIEEKQQDSESVPVLPCTNDQNIEDASIEILGHDGEVQLAVRIELSQLDSDQQQLIHRFFRNDNIVLDKINLLVPHHKVHIEQHEYSFENN